MKDVVFEIDEALKDLLQREVFFRLNGKVVKSGKVYLFEHGHFNYVFNIETKTKKTTLKLPYPFDYSKSDGLIVFDYRIKTFTNNKKELIEAVESMRITSPSKFYDNLLKIHF